MVLLMACNVDRVVGSHLAQRKLIVQGACWEIDAFRNGSIDPGLHHFSPGHLQAVCRGMLDQLASLRLREDRNRRRLGRFLLDRLRSI